MKTHMLLSVCAGALALAAAPETGSGTGSGPDTGAADDLLKSDAAPRPLTADQVAPAEPSSDPSPSAVGNEPGADPNPPTTGADAETTTAPSSKAGKKPAAKDKTTGKAEKAEPAAGVKRAYMVWAQPGHESIGIGQLIAVPTREADVLRGAGRARFASDAEVEAAKGSEDPGVVLILDGV